MKPMGVRLVCASLFAPAWACAAATTLARLCFNQRLHHARDFGGGVEGERSFCVWARREIVCVCVICALIVCLCLGPIMAAAVARGGGS